MSTHMDTICVIGCGFVGENLIDIFSNKFNVIGYDTSDYVIRLLQHKFSSHKNSKNISIQSNTQNINSCKLFCISVPTPVNPDNSIDISYIQSAVNLVNTHAPIYSSVVIESSVHVGMTRKLLEHLVNNNIYVGVSPERIDLGRTSPAVHEIPKILAGINNESLTHIKAFYDQCFSSIVTVSSLETAEMCKLAENSFRMINICYANEVSDACKHHNINYNELLSACSTKPFGFMPFYAGLGVGGSCIPINPYWLAANNHMPLLSLATHLTNERPTIKAIEFYNEFHPKKLLIVGMSFKKNVSSMIRSPTISFAYTLKQYNDTTITIFDPLAFSDVYNLSFTEKLFNILDLSDWNPTFIDEHFDHVCIIVCHDIINMSILNLCKKTKIIYFP